MGIGGLWRISGWLKTLKDDVFFLYFAWKHPDTSLYVKGLLLGIVVYVFSPIDILPDFLPLIGVVDDLTIISVGLLYAKRLLPASVRAACSRESEQWSGRVPRILRLVMVCVIGWVLLLILGLSYFIFRNIKG